MCRVSIIITNYNYGAYLPEAIDSALAQNWPDVEVVVSDDGSTDHSVSVVRSYGDRVRLVTGPNSGQRVAGTRGFLRSTGDVVVFLDADDVLPPGLARAAAESMAPSVSKVQFQMQRTDRSGRAMTSPLPAFRRTPSSRDVARWFRRTSAYPTPPGSANAYPRWLCDLLLPADPSVGEALDSPLLAAAPLLGDVVTVPGVVVSYRQHGANDSDLLNDRSRFAREVGRALGRWRYALTVAGEESLGDRPLFRSRELLQFRVSAQRSGSATSPLPGDGYPRMVCDAVTTLWAPGPESVKHRLMVTGWCLATLFAPRPLVPKLLRARYSRTV